MIKYGVIVAPDPANIKNKWFLHRCTSVDQTFQFEPDTTKYYSFDSMVEAQEWFNKWYAGRAMGNLWLPPASKFSIQVIPE